MSQIQDFEPQNGVQRMHSIPRFGHSNSFANLASTSVSVRDDYIDGVMAFCIFLSLFFIVWCLILLSLKFYYGVDRVGCAAGGRLVHVNNMRKMGVSRFRRKRIIMRNWRIQYIFLGASITLPALSVMLVNRGLEPFLASLVQVQEINNNVDMRAQVAIQTTRRLVDLGAEWNQLVSHDWLTTHCPNYNASTWASQTELVAVEQNIVSSSHEMNRLEQELANNQTLDTLQSVTQTSATVENAIDWVLEHDWIVKVFLIALNVINALFFLGACLAKNNMDCQLFQDVTSYLLLPLFCIVTLGTIGATCAFVILAMGNADFCSGGGAPGSPMGTFLDSAIQLGYNKSSLVYESLNYYALDCTPTNPFSILVDTESLVSKTSHSIRKLHKDLRGLQPSFYQSECGGDMLRANSTLYEFQQIFHSIRSNLDVALEVTDCSNVTQIFKEFSFGMTCTDSVDGLGWMFSMVLGITILSMVMLTTRAALFNPLIKGKRKKRREKEFEEYKEYMSQFYEVSEWKIDVHPDEKKSRGIARMETFETEETDETNKLSPTSSDGSEEETEQENKDNPSLLYEVNSAATALPITGKDDDDISYYSSDSDWDGDESAFSISSSVAAFMNFVANVRKQRRDEPPEDDTVVDNDDRSSVVSSVYTTISEFVGSFLGKAKPHEARQEEPTENDTEAAAPPPLTTPKRFRIPANDPLHLGFYHNNSDILSDASSQEMEPLSPPLLPSSGGPKAPRKGMKTFARTSGGSKC